MQCYNENEMQTITSLVSSLSSHDSRMPSLLHMWYMDLRETNGPVESIHRYCGESHIAILYYCHSFVILYSMSFLEIWNSHWVNAVWHLYDLPSVLYKIVHYHQVDTGRRLHWLYLYTVSIEWWHKWLIH